MRTCVVCNEEKELNTTNFHIKRANPLGFDTRCKECANKYYRERNERRRLEKLEEVKQIMEER